MKLKEHLVEKINNILLELGVSYDAIDNFEAYMEGSLEEQVFFNCLPKIDIESLQDDIVEQLVNTYKSLERHKADEYIEKYIRILFEIGEKSTLCIIKKLHYVYLTKEICEKLLQYKIKPAFVISYYAGYLVSREDNLSSKFISFFDNIYKKHENEFQKAFDISDVREQVIIASYEVYKNPNEKKELCNWLNQFLVYPEIIFTLFDEKLLDYDKERICKYIKEGALSLDELVEDLISRKVHLNIDSWLLKILMVTSYNIIDNSEIARRFLKFSITIYPEKSFNCLNNYFFVRGYIEISNLIDKLHINRAAYIAWLCKAKCRYGFEYSRELKQELDLSKENFIKALNLCTGINKANMIYILLEQGEGIEYVNELENAFINEFSSLMDKLDIEKNVTEHIINYLRGETDFENIKYNLNLLRKKEVYDYYSKYYEILFWLKDVSPMFEKAIKVFIATENSYILSKIYDKFEDKYKNNLASFIEFLNSYGAKINNYILLLGGYAVGQTKFRMEAESFIIKLIAEDRDELVKVIDSCPADIRIYLLEKLFKFNKEKNVKVLICHLCETSKAVREKIIELLAPYIEGREYVIPSLSAKKQAVREAAVKILSKSSNKNVIEALNNTLEVEKNEKIKVLIRKALNLENPLEEKSEEIDILEYCKKSLKGNKVAALKWLEFDTLPKIRFKNSDKFAEDEIIKYMLLCYVSYMEIGLNDEENKINELLDHKDLSKLALEVLERWINLGAESKKKWVLYFSAIYGEYDVVSVLKKNIEEWPKVSRGAIASEAVRALALNGSNEALIIVDNIGRKFKFKQVKNAASEALKFAAEKLKIDIEELSDRIVPDLGFDVKGQRVFDYGDRKFIVTLTPELTLEVVDEKGKKFKNLPKSGKNDDEIKATKALGEFKNLKKQLKTVVSVQAIRLEMALSSDRKWSKEAWVKLFVKNPIMHKFAIGLVWGIYKEDTLTDTFRYMEDGTFNTKDEDEYNLEENSVIGLVHPIELNKEDMELWKEQLENYEIKQPLEQLNREWFRISKEEKIMKTVERFGGIMLNGLSLLGKLTAFGWSRGSVSDGAGYYSFYKEDHKLQIGVELNFSGLSIGLENEEVTLYDLIFYKKGTVKRGSYVYDTVKKENIIIPSEIPNRFFSEILYQINKLIASKTGTNENWKEELK